MFSTVDIADVRGRAMLVLALPWAVEGGFEPRLGHDGTSVIAI
jgi:hypothetical protein